MFTSISRLRDSRAEQSRVTKVANNIKKMNANWKDDWYFPVLAVGLSNPVEDVEWVLDSNTRLENTQKHVYVGATQSTAAKTIQAVTSALSKLAETRLTSRNKTAYINERLTIIDHALDHHFGVPGYSWFLHPISLTESTPTVATQQTPIVEVANEAPAYSPPLASIDALRAAFESAFTDIPDFAIRRSTRNPEGVYENDRTQGKFMAFVRTLEAVRDEKLSLADLFGVK